MSETPKILSRDQIIGLLVDSFLSRTTTVTDLRKGSVLLSLLEAYGEAGFRISSDVIAALDSISIDRASGDALKRIALDKKVPIYSSTLSTGFVDITDKSFEKVEDKIYAGRPAPVAGSSFIFVNDGTPLPATGAIYLSRGTNLVEGPLTYGTTVRTDPDDGVTPVQGVVAKSGGAYYMIVLDSANETTKFHNLGDSVVLAQGGDRIIPVGTVVQTSQATSAEAVQFNTTAAAKILDGEVKVEKVPVVSQLPGTKSNVARGAIREVLGTSFDAECTNTLSITSARDDDTDEVLRERIKKYEQSRTKGTEAAIINASIDVVSPDELKRVSSAAIKRTTGAEQILIFDDGTGYEAVDDGVGLEQLMDEAMGGEKEFQLLNSMIERASVKTLNTSPYDLIDGDTLSVEISGLGVFTHTFQNAFNVYRQADAFEVVSSINSDYALPFTARTIEGGKRVVLTPKDAHNIKVLSGGANDGLAFPTNAVHTIRLYRNDKAVSQEGKKAFVTSISQSSWSTITNGSTFRFSVDNTPFVAVTVNDADFQVYGATYLVSKDMPLDIWAKVLNDKLSGITVEVLGDKLRFTSNLGTSDRAAVKMDTTNTGYISTAMFGTNAVVEDYGISSDFNLNLKTGQLEFVEPFSVGETVTAGSKFTRAKVDSSILPTALSLGSNRIYMFLAVDGNADVIAHNVTGTTLQLTDEPGGYPANTVKVEANIGAFTNVKVGDYMIAWKNVGETFLTDNNLGVFRVLDIDLSANKQFVIINNPNCLGNEGPVALPAIGRLVFVRSSTHVQTIEINPLTVTSPSTLRDALNAQLIGAKATSIGTVVRIQSKSLDDSKSELLVAAVTDNIAPLGYEVGKYSAVSSHNGFAASDAEYGYGMPSFKLLKSDNSSVSPDIIDNGKYFLNDGTENDIIQWLNWNTGYFNYSGGSLTTYSHPSLNKDSYEQVKEYDETISKIKVNRKGLTYRGIYDTGTNKFLLNGGYYADEPYTLRQGLVFDAQDKLSFILDQDDKVKAFITPVARKVKVKGSPIPTASLFDLSDAESNLALNNPATFRDFNFANFKFWIQPKLTLQNMKFKYKDFGPAGSKVGLSLGFPSAADSEATHLVNEGPITEIRLIPATGASETDASDASTTWTAEIIATVGNIDYVKYTYRTGTAPGLVVSQGSIVHIAQGSSLHPKNKGDFRLTENILYPATSTTFTIERPIGAAQHDILSIPSIDFPSVSFNPIIPPYNQGAYMRIITSAAHNVQQGDVIGIYGNDVAEYNTSLEVVNVAAPTVMDVFVPAGTFNGEALKTTQRVKLASGTISAHSMVTSYVEDDIVRTGAGPTYNYYIAVAPSLGVAPPNPTYWKYITAHIDSADAYVTFYETVNPHNLSAANNVRIRNVPTLASTSPDIDAPILTVSAIDKFSHLHVTGIAADAISYTIITAGRVDQQSATYGSLSKGLKFDDALDFFPVTDDQTALQTYIDTNLSDLIEVDPQNPTDLIVPTDSAYTSGGSVSFTVNPIYGSYDRLVTFTTVPPYSRGALITLVPVANANPLRADVNGTFQVISIDDKTIRIRSTRLSTPSDSASLALTGTWTATQSVFGFGDAESYVLQNNLPAVPVSPTFTLKKPLLDIEADDEAYLISTTAEQLSRLFANLANSGLDNLAEIESSLTDGELQVKTDTFGSDGGVQMSGGRGNIHSAAVIGNGQTRNGIAGLDIETDLRIGLTPGSYVRVSNTIPQRKILGINNTTNISITIPTAGKANIQITSGAGVFQTARAVTVLNTTWKIEKHGNFVCYSQVAGTATNLIANGVKEGDWVRINDPILTPKFLSNNTGIYKIVRLYGDAFWIENSEAVEQWAQNITATSIKFYSHDSVMPGDKVTISSNILGQSNIGSFTVDEWDDSLSIPSATTIRVLGTLTAQGATALGSDAVHFNVVEKDALSLVKKIHSTAPSSTGNNYSFIGVDSDELIERISATAGGAIASMSKLNMDESTKLGLDAYRYYEGLIAQLYKVIYGDPSDPAFEGVRAAGTDIDIQPPLIRRVQVTLSLRIKSGTPFLEIIDAVRSAASGYINTLNVGQPVSLSAMTSAVQNVDGVLAVTVTDTNPTENNGLIKVLPEEVAKVVNPGVDITVNIVSG